MKKVLRVIVALAAILFLVTGLRYVIDPAGTVAEFGMPLLDGLGRSSQLGDLTAYFFSLAVFIFTALILGKRSWFYPPAILLGLTAVFRLLAWLIHDAALAINFIALEVIVTCLLLFAASRLATKE